MLITSKARIAKYTKEFETSLRTINDISCKVAVMARIKRAEQGNFGDYKHLEKGMFELKIDRGPGYRVYFGIAGNGRIVLLLLAGTKRNQGRDIFKALELWKDYTAHEEIAK